MAEFNPVPSTPDVGAVSSGNTPKPTRPGAWQIWLALAVAIAGPLIYTACLGQAYLRSSGLPLYVGLGLGSIWALVLAVRHRRWWVRTVTAVIVITTVGLTILFNQPTPAPTGFASLTLAPDFTLPDEHGQPVSLKAELSRGPVHLVFYRGHW